ncbi:MAG: NAD(P)H-binding protein [Kiritimatiellae bacterium]|nr:NAD(P)H-binding protein [Kiritimatiellia bacterium]
MKIAIVAANGRVGKLVAEEAVKRGHDVTAVVRGENKTAAPKSLVKDALALAPADLAGFDAVVDAVGGWTADTVGAIPSAAKHLAGILSGTSVRLLVVGGAGSLYVNPERTLTVADDPGFPADWKPLAAAHAEALAYLRGCKDLRWTYISPAADFQSDGPRTGAYELHGEDFTPNAAGQSVLSYADFAIAMVDEIERAAHVGERISLVQKA